MFFFRIVLVCTLLFTVVLFSIKLLKCLFTVISVFVEILLQIFLLIEVCIQVFFNFSRIRLRSKGVVLIVQISKSELFSGAPVWDREAADADGAWWSDDADGAGM